LAGQRPLSNYTSSGKNAQRLIQPNFLFAAQTDFPWAGIVASLRIMPPAGYANIPTFMWVQIECGASATLAKLALIQNPQPLQKIEEICTFVNKIGFTGAFLAKIVWHDWRKLFKINIWRT
jgi:hypothetical protein